MRNPPLPHKDIVDRVRTIQAVQRRAANPIAYTAWTDPESFSNGWGHFDTGQTTYPHASYMKASDGTVLLRGVIQGGTSGASVVVFTLPEGFRPAYRAAFCCSCGSLGAQFARIDVNPDGSVIAVSVPATGFLSLDNVRFVAEA